MKRFMAVTLLACALATGCDSTSNADAEVRARSSPVDSSDSNGKSSTQKAEVAGVRRVGTEELFATPGSALLALSVEEAAWLDRHGYPTLAELAALQSYDPDLLEDAARNRGDMKSAALLGHRLAEGGDIGGAIAAFSNGANLGSLYARQQHALHSALRATQLPIDQLANSDQGTLGILLSRLEVARLLGDHRAGALIEQYGANFNWDQYGKGVLAQVATFMDQYGAHARARGRRPVGPDPRPNAELWDELQGQSGSLVTVYTRNPAGT